MTEYIKRKDVHLALDSHYFTGKLSLRKTIDSVPSADVVERKTGEWYDKGSLSCRCSNCGCKSTKEFNFCPHCGADMRHSDD